MSNRPFKDTREKLEAIGCEFVRRDPGGILMSRPDGRFVFLHTNVSQKNADNLLCDVRVQLGLPRREVRPTNVRHADRPVLDLTRLRASGHAQTRLRQMRAQSPITADEIIAVLRKPSRVAYSVRHESWLWVGPRITVAMFVSDDGDSVIKTVLWSSEELWTAHPRPEKATV